ncbi:muscarinic acetylcholine receptor M1-like [Patiria miniata]|uniref:G-protein coupled receptors family 1 profile domain-containing protein n=1 Tax=Patiria miniata TaxID=46514 RepID=A0A913ZYP7_PATMI|nr:muscarinic acetylcholine receptor M1-like [Patiria miniata]
MSLHQALGHHGMGDMAMGNGSDHATDDYFADSERISSWLLLIVCGVLMCVAVPCNLLVLTAFLLEKKLRTYGNLFIINLCVADLCVGTINMPLTILEESMKLMGHGWPFGHTFCHFVKTLEHTFFTASIVTILIICNDRYQAIRHPLSHLQSRTTKGAGLKILMAWGVAIFVWLSFIFVWGVVEGEDALPHNFCTAMYNTNHYSTGVAIGVVMWIPYPAIMIMYCRVYQTIHAVRGGKGKGSMVKKTAKNDNSSQEEETSTKFTVSGIGHSHQEIPTISVKTVQLTFCEKNGGSNARRDCENNIPVDTSLPGSAYQTESQNRRDDEETSKTRAMGETPITAPPTVSTSPAQVESSPIPQKNIALRRTGKTHADNKKATLTLSLVVASYAISWLPYGIIVPITSICQMHPDAFPHCRPTTTRPSSPSLCVRVPSIHSATPLLNRPFDTPSSRYSHVTGVDLSLQNRHTTVGIF